MKMSLSTDYDIAKNLFNLFSNNDILHGFVRDFDIYDGFIKRIWNHDWYLEEVRSICCECGIDKIPQELEYEYCYKMINSEFLIFLSLQQIMLEPDL